MTMLFGTGIFTTGKFELVVVWENGDKDVYTYDTEAQASEAGDGMKVAFGDQIEWYGTRPQMKKG